MAIITFYNDVCMNYQTNRHAAKPHLKATSNLRPHIHIPVFQLHIHILVIQLTLHFNSIMQPTQYKTNFLQPQR